MKLIVQIAAQNKTRCQEFYKSLDFELKQLDENRSVAYDSQFEILMNHSTNARLNLQLFPDDYDSYIQKFEEKKENDSGALILCPSGVQLQVNKKQIKHHQSENKTLLGTYYGAGIECFDLNKSLAFWNKLGFEKIMGGLEAGFIVLKADEHATITLYSQNSCKHQFFNPSITFFNGKEGNPKVIEKIREKGIFISEEITIFNDKGIVDNIIVGDPGGLHFFLFNDG